MPLVDVGPGVGAIVALTYVAAIDDPAGSSPRKWGPHFGLTPKKYQSGETDFTGRISKIGDASVRTVLYEAAHVILTRAVKGGWLEELGDEARPAHGNEEGEGGAGAQARRRSASDVGRWNAVSAERRRLAAA